MSTPSIYAVRYDILDRKYSQLAITSIKNLSIRLLPSLLECVSKDRFFQHIVGSLDIIDARILANPAFYKAKNQGREKCV